MFHDELVFGGFLIFSCIGGGPVPCGNTFDAVSRKLRGQCEIVGIAESEFSVCGPEIGVETTKVFPCRAPVYLCRGALSGHSVPRAVFLVAEVVETLLVVIVDNLWDFSRVR